MGRRARLKQGAPDALSSTAKAPLRKSGFVRSGGKWKPIVEEGEKRRRRQEQVKEKKANKVRASKGKAKATEEEDGFDEVDEEEEAALKAARECVHSSSASGARSQCSHRVYFDPEDLEEDGAEFSPDDGAAIEGDLEDLVGDDEFDLPDGPAECVAHPV